MNRYFGMNWRNAEVCRGAPVLTGERLEDCQGVREPVEEEATQSKSRSSVEASLHDKRARYFFGVTRTSSALAFLFHPWKREKSPASHASRSPGLLRSQSGRISLVTTRRSCQRSMTDGRPQNQ